MIIAHHLILSAYGHWLPNDPRGSGSDALREEKFEDLGPIHHGRKRVQPPRTELREFYRRAAPRLNYAPIWFDDAKRQAIADAFANVVASQRYTVWACAIHSNHAHLCVRRHRDDAVTMMKHLSDVSRDVMRRFGDVADNHPVWSQRPYKVFLKTPEDVRRCIDYIRLNPVKEGLGEQIFPFVTAYDGWPHPRR